MQTTNLAPITLFKLLGHDLRWKMVQYLVRGDYRVQDLAALLKAAPNLVSYHLHQLEEAALVQERRSDADGRDVFFHLDLEQLQRCYEQAGLALHPAFAGFREEPAPASGEPLRVLFLCTHNSARSQIAEALLRHYSHGTIEVASAGTQPTEVHPMTLETLRRVQIPVEDLRAKQLDTLLGQHVTHVVTVCDRAHEICPSFPDATVRLHWSLPDPAALPAGPEQQRAFERTLQQLTTMTRYFLHFVHKEHIHDPAGSHPLHGELGPLTDG